MTAATHRGVGALSPLLCFVAADRQDTITVRIVRTVRIVSPEPMKPDPHQAIASYAMTVLGLVFAVFQLVCGAELDFLLICAVVRARSDRHTQDVFRALPDREDALVEGMSLRSTSLPANRLLASEGEVGLGLFRIARGWAYRYRCCANGNRQILDFLMPGEIVGLQAALLGVMEHSVRSLTPLRATVFDARLVGDAFRSEPALALRFARHLAAESSRVDEMLTVIGCGDAAERLAFLMISLYRRQARLGPVDPLDCPFPLRRQHMADALGLTGAHINRTLNRLRDDGVAAIENQRLAIRDFPQLAALAGTPA
jgi:CRP/FNR family transcriptional regulator, anaerobic regulatory protein